MKITRLVMLPLIALSLALAACGGDEVKETPPPEEPKMSDAEAIIGSWKSGSTVISFKNGGGYIWDVARACGTPPCPTTRTKGRYELRRGQVYLDPEEGQDQVLNYNIMWNPRRMHLRYASGGTGEWNLTYMQ